MQKKSLALHRRRNQSNITQSQCAMCKCDFSGVAMGHALRRQRNIPVDVKDISKDTVGAVLNVARKHYLDNGGSRVLTMPCSGDTVCNTCITVWAKAYGQSNTLVTRCGRRLDRLPR